MTKRFDHLFDKSSLPPKFQEHIDRIKAGDQEFVDQPSDAEDDDGPPFFGATSWTVPFHKGGVLYFTILYSRAMDLAAVARSLAAGCMVRQLGVCRGDSDTDGLPPLVSVVGSMDACWKIQSDLRRVIGKVPAYLRSCQPGVAAKPKKKPRRNGGQGRNGMRGQNGARTENGAQAANGAQAVNGAGESGAGESGAGKSEASDQLFVAGPRTKPAPGTEKLLGKYADLFRVGDFVEGMVRVAVPPPDVDRFDFGTLKERPTGHLTAAPLYREGDRVWEIRLKSGQRAFVLLFDEADADALMGLRVMTTTALTWVDAIERGELGPDDLLPPVVPIVVYRGAELWNAPTDIRHVISQRYTGLEGTHEQEYLVIDMDGASRMARQGVLLPPDTIVRASMIATNKGEFVGQPIKTAFMTRSTVLK